MSFAKPGPETRAYLAELPRLGLARMLVFSFGMLAYVAMLRMVSSWLQKHLAPPTEALVTVELLWFGVVFALGRFYLDAITDPVVGHWSDHTRSRWGRRKPFILAGLFPTVICLIALFALEPTKLFGIWAYPDAETARLVNGLLYTLLASVYFISSTLLAIPYLSTIPEITPHPTDRKWLTGLLGVLVVFGTVIGQAMPGLMPSLFQAAVIVGAIGLVSMGIVLLFFRNPPWARFGFTDQPAADVALPVESETVPGESRSASEAPSSLISTGSTKVEAESEAMSPRGGFALFLNSLFFGFWQGVRAVFMLITAPLWRYAYGKRTWLMRKRDPETGEAIEPDANTITIVGGGAPPPLKPLGRSLRDLTQFKPFLGFIGAFVSLHAAFVLMTISLPYIPQTLLGLNSAETYHAYITGDEIDYGGDALLHAFGPLPSIARDFAELQAEDPFLQPVDLQDQPRRYALVDVAKATKLLESMRAERPRLDAEAYGNELLAQGILVDRGPKSAAEWNRHILERLNDLGNFQASIILGVALGSTLFIGLPLILLLLFLIGKRRTCLVSLALFVTVPVLTPFVSLEGVAIPGWQLIYAIGAIVGIAMAGIFVLDNLLLSEVVEMDTSLTGQRRESLYFGIYGLLMKMGIGLATLLTALLFTYVGHSFEHAWGVRLAGPLAASLVLCGLSIFIWLYPSDTGVESIVRNPKV